MKWFKEIHPCVLQGIGPFEAAAQKGQEPVPFLYLGMSKSGLFLKKISVIS